MSEAIRTSGPKGTVQHQILPIIQHWCDANAGSVGKCFLTHDAEPTVYVIPRSGKYEFTLDDRLSELESALFTAGRRIGVLQMPAPSAGTSIAYFDPSHAALLFSHTG